MTPHNNPLPPNLIVGRADGGHLLHNIAAFAKLLRQSGMDGGLDKTAAAAAALAQTGIAVRADVFWALAAVFVCRRQQLPLFRQAFNQFWRGLAIDEDDVTEEFFESTTAPNASPLSENILSDETAADIPLAAATTEHLQEKDFEKMRADEWQQAMLINRRLTAVLPPLPSRRFASAASGEADMRRTVRRALSRNGDYPHVYYKRRRTQPPHVIMLLDISGSMSVYARAFVHFAAGMLCCRTAHHQLFLLGTRLTAARIGQHSHAAAADAIAACASDWDGGTRLSPLLRQFNHQWLRRIQLSHAIVLFATDGLEVHCDETAFAHEVERLQKSCHRLLWLNPLLRYQHYAPLARGARVLSRYAAQTHSIHNVRAIADLADLLKKNFAAAA